MVNSENIEEAILPFKVQQLVEIIMQKKSLAFEDALHYLYTSTCYLALQSKDAKFWYMSGVQLYEMLEDEKHTQRKLAVENSKQMLFSIFCLESYKEHTGKSAIEILSLFHDCQVFNFLTENFEVLHTQSKEYITSEVDAYLKGKKS